MWISLIIALITYLLQSNGNESQKRNALLSAAAAGAITYGVTEYTDWGKETLKPLDTKISNWISPTQPPRDAAVTPTKAITEATDLWDKVKEVAPVALAAGALTSGGLDKYLPWVLGGLAIVVLNK